MNEIDTKHKEMVMALKADGQTVANNFTMYRGAILVNVIEALKQLSDSLDEIKKHVVYNNPRLPEPELGKEGNDTYPITAKQGDILHYALGMLGETLEQAYPLMEYAIVRRGLGDIDMENALEERGDMEWYLKLGDSLLGFTNEQIIEHNTAKLSLRFPNMTFSKEHAEQRLDKVGTSE